jgi:putative DNA primase/helicase
MRLASAGHTVVYLVRTVALADELAQRVEPRVRVRVWRGPDRKNPDRPGQTMCREPELIREARSVQAHPDKVVCPICLHRETCAYLEQKAATASIWFGASSLLWHEMPAPMKGAKLVIVDESFALDGLMGLEGPPILVGVEDLKREPRHRSSVFRTGDLLAELMPRRRQLLAALQDHPLGWIERDRLIAAGLTAADCSVAREAEWRAKIEVRKQTTFDKLRKALALARGNRDVVRRAMLWEVLQQLLKDENAARSGQAELIEEIDKETGIAYRAIRLYWASPVVEEWAELPILHLDATSNLTVLRARFPHAELIVDAAADEPHVHVIQYHSHTFGRDALVANKKLLTEVWRSAISHAQLIGGKWLIVIQKAVEQIIRGWGKSGEPIPPFVAIAHHNELAGLDCYRAVRGIIVIGRTLPPPSVVERITGILAGYAIPTCGDWYPGEMVTLKASDGSVATVEHDVHPDPLADAVLRQICDDELMQIIGRGRGAHRTAHEPLDIVIFGSVPIPVPLHELRVWSRPSLDDQLLARGGVTLSSCGDVGEAFGLNPGSVKKDRQRENWQMGTNPYKSFLYGNVPICQFSAGALRGAIYRRDKPRHGEQRVVYDPRIVSDPRVWLIDRIGPLALFELAPAAGSPAASPETSGAGVETRATELRHPVQVRRERDRVRQMARRRATGMVPRADYLAKNSLSKRRPWEQDGISRRTWERHRARTTTGMIPPPSFVASPSEMTETGSLQHLQIRRGLAAVPPLPAAEKAGGSVPVILTKPIQLDFFTDYLAGYEQEPLPEWNGGVAPPPIRQAIVRELRRRGARHEDLADVVGLSRSQITNVLRGRFGTALANADALKRLLGFWSSAA